MRPSDQNVQANCTVERQVVNPRTQQQAWEVYETINLKGPTVEHVIERAQLYVGRPERHDNVSAIRLTGTMTVIDQQKDRLFNHVNTIKMDLYVLRERVAPVAAARSMVGG